MTKANELLNRITAYMKKYKYAVIILIIGIGLLLIPEKKKENSMPKTNTFENESGNQKYVTDMEQKIASVLSQIEGVGRVEVVLTLKQGEEKHILSDKEIRSESSERGTITEESVKAVLISKGSSYDEPIVTGQEYPLFQGALIVCEGGGDAELKLQLTQAVSALTNLSSHKITILKMK